MTYIGRFAPSPTGELHLGSLFAALASYLDARHQGGSWLVRMEDLDPPREQPGAADAILHSLEAHRLTWDGSVSYQSQRQQAYRRALQQLREAGLTYPCNCSRQRLKSQPVYDRHCLHHPAVKRPFAVRLRIPEDRLRYICCEDIFCGTIRHDLLLESGDFVVRRKDGLFAYQLAVVVDDIAQGITHIIRGRDLLESTPRQCLLFRLLDSEPPQMGHLPVLVNRTQQKLSKQTHAPPIDSRHASNNLWLALRLLGLPPPAELHGDSCEILLEWALQHWRREAVPSCSTIEAL